MYHPVTFVISLALVWSSHAQQLADIWQTSWDQSSLLKSVKPSSPINFATPILVGSANITIDDTKVYQPVLGFGGSLTDSSASLFNDLKIKNSASYWNLLNYLFSPVNGAGLSYLRVPLGATDFSAKAYTFDESVNDTCLWNFDINNAPAYLFSTLNDIQTVNSMIRVHVLPWSPPAWMKDGGTLNGGSLQSSLVDVYATYLLKCLQGFKSKGITAYAISVQNEPQNVNPTFPTAKLTPVMEGQIGTKLRTLMNSNGFPKTKLIGYEHNWDTASTYPVQLMQAAGAAFDGVAFHCYGGSVDQQDTFNKLFPNKEIYMTQCTGTIGTNWWGDLKWYMNNIFIGSVTRNAQAALMWNLALDGTGSPKLPGTNNCGASGCRGIVQINSDGTYKVNQEFYAMAHASKAIIALDVGGPSAKRIGVTIGGNMNWALVAGAYVTGRAKPSDPFRYSIVVLNWNNNVAACQPASIQATIHFRGKQAIYTFPVGVTTLSWYSATGTALTGREGEVMYAKTEAAQQTLYFNK